MKKILLASVVCLFTSLANASVFTTEISCSSSDSFTVGLNGLPSTLAESYIKTGSAFHIFTNLTSTLDENTTAHNFTISQRDLSDMATAGVTLSSGSVITLKLTSGHQFDLTCQ